MRRILRAGCVLAGTFGFLLVSIHALARQAPQSFPAAADERSLRLIVVGSEAEAEALERRLASGENFIAVATQVSIDPSASRGGWLGRLALSALRPELRAAIAGLAVGQVSHVVRVPTGFAIVQVVPDEAGAAEGTANPAIAAAGSIRYATDVSGMGEAILAMNQYPHPADWDQDPRGLCDARTRSMAGIAERLAAAAAPSSGGDPIQAHYLLGQVHAYYGRMAASIEEFARARELAVTGAPTVLPTLDESLGIAYLQKAGLDNHVFRAPEDFCLLEPSGTRPLRDPTDAQRAVEHLQRYLAGAPDDLEGRWLLNLAYMETGGYPAKVPKPYLIPASAFNAPGDDVGHFVDVAAEAGLTSFASAGGLIVDDFDNDGRLDVLTSSVDSCDGMHFFVRNANGTFAERATPAGVADQRSALNMVQADYDNDGDVDVLLLRGGWEFPQRKSLLRNNGDGTFTDVTAASGLAAPAVRSQTAAWTDINNDGLLDLFVGVEQGPAQLFLNKGDGTFVDIARAAGVARTAFSKGVAAADFDNDGWPDLFVSNIGGPSFLYHNNHDGTFTDVAKAVGLGQPSQSFAAWFFDYDNDGWIDIFQTSYFTSVDETVRTYLQLPHNAATLKLYRNRGDFHFEDVTRETGLDRVYMPMGANFGDIDNDGFLDIYLGTGNPSYGSLVPSVLLHNRGGRRFTDVTFSSGTGELHKGHGVAFADLDNDGQEDLIFEVGGATPGDAHALRLFHNPGHPGDWITLKLTGVKSNRSAIGARITVSVEDAHGARRAIHRTVGSGGSFGASPLAQHIGLGEAARILDIEVYWPTTNSRQHIPAPGRNRWLQIAEGATTFQTLARPPLPFTRAAAAMPSSSR